MNPYHHALSSVRKWGGKVADYLAIHQFFDESKAHVADIRHRALRHHAEGIFLCERIFGPTITNSAGRVIPTRYIGEQHVKEDLGGIPSLKDWFQHIEVRTWMLKVAMKPEDLEGPPPSSNGVASQLGPTGKRPRLPSRHKPRSKKRN
jgi:Domain of unknown function (DUF6915)